MGVSPDKGGFTMSNCKCCGVGLNTVCKRCGKVLSPTRLDMVKANKVPQVCGACFKVLYGTF